MKVVREFFDAVHHTSKLDNHLGYKVLAFCGLVMVGLYAEAVYLEMQLR